MLELKELYIGFARLIMVYLAVCLSAMLIYPTFLFGPDMFNSFYLTWPKVIFYQMVTIGDRGSIILSAIIPNTLAMLLPFVVFLKKPKWYGYLTAFISLHLVLLMALISSF